MKLKVRDYVILSKKAIKKYYGKPDAPLDYVANPSWENMTSEQFSQFVGEYLGFYSGEGVGVVAVATDKLVKVVFLDVVKGEVTFSWFKHSELEAVDVEFV
jgi:hypothetical protein